MSATAEEVLKEALSLDEEDRVSIAGALIESLQGEAEPGAEEAWAGSLRGRPLVRQVGRSGAAAGVAPGVDTSFGL